MDSFAVHVDKIAHVPSVDNNLRMVNVTRVTIHVGEHGPFTKDFPEGQDGPETINAWKNQKALEVQSVVG